MINEHVSEWLGYPVKDFIPDDSEKPVTDADQTIYRLRVDWESEISFAELLVRFLANESVSKTPAIIIGAWNADDSMADNTEIVQLLVGARNTLTSLQGIFMGDILSEENEISWITQSDLSPLLVAYPKLQHLRVRGATSLSLGGHLRHEGLKSLIIETGGLGATQVAEVLSLDLPNLEHLDLRLGTPNYGGDCTVSDLKSLLDGGLFPKLRHLGLKDAAIADQVAAAVVSAPILARLQSLDLSLGTLSDVGAEELLKSEAIRGLSALNLYHHYCSNAVMERLKKWNPSVNLNRQEKADDEYGPYVAVSE